jgi:hypothetical protein
MNLNVKQYSLKLYLHEFALPNHGGVVLEGFYWRLHQSRNKSDNFYLIVLRQHTTDLSLLRLDVFRHLVRMIWRRAMLIDAFVLVTSCDADSAT